ncbi:MAG: right-handed parallel beta-helix repeat-containing protein [Solirubrobacteraceae bacterium]|nr:right-handed parallel beta-helix repeat-containing protein [Solirubrobacteraceae bacterium]
MSNQGLNESEAKTRRAVIGGAALAGAGAAAMLTPNTAAASASLDTVTVDTSGMGIGDTLVYKGTTSPQVKPEITEYVWVKTATGNAATDRQNILDAIAEARSTKRAVHLRRGNYKVDATIAPTVTAGDPSIVIRGFGDDSVIFTDDANIRILHFTGADGLTLESFKVKGPNSVRAQQTGIRVTTSADVTIRDVTVFGSCGSGINLQSCTRSRVLDCRVIESWSDGIGVYGSTGANSSDIIISGNFVHRAGDDAISVVRYVDTITNTNLNSASYNAHHLRVQIIGNNIRDGGANGIHVVGGRQVQVHSNVIDGTRAVGILVDRDSQVGGNYPGSSPAFKGTSASQIVQVHGNIVRRAGRVVCPGDPDASSITNALLVPNAQTQHPVNRFGIYVSDGTINSQHAWLRTEDVTVVDNQVHEPVGRGVVIRGRSNGTVVGNAVRDAVATGFDVAGDASISIEGLVFSRNRAYNCHGNGVLIQYAKNGVVEGNVALNNSVASTGGFDNFRFEFVNSITVRDNHSIDDRPTKQIDKTYEFGGTSDGITLAGNRERAGSQTLGYSGTVTNVHQAEMVVYTGSTVPSGSVYAIGQLALENGAQTKLRVKAASSWVAVTLT